MNMSRMTPVYRVDTGRFNSPTNPSLLWWGTVLRLALMAGHPVVLIGACRTGKSLLLSKLTPDKILDKRNEAIHSKRPIVITEGEIPEGIFSVDDCDMIEPTSIRQLASAMANQNRSFCLATQRYVNIKDAVDAYRKWNHAKRVIVVVVDGQMNPMPILQELPQ